MITTRRTKRVFAVALGLSLIAAACGGSDDTADAPADEPATTDADAPADEPSDADAPADEPSDTTADEPTTTDAPTDMYADAAMKLTVDLNPDAVWEDGSPITVTDLQCTLDAQLNTPGSLSTTGFDQILGIEQGDSEKQAIMYFATVYAPYKTLFNPIQQASMHDDCNDISLDFEDTPPTSGRAFKFQEWSSGQSILVRNENYWGEPAKADSIVMVPFADQDTEKAAIASGEVDFIRPQFDPGFAAVAEDANVGLDVQFGADYEGFYFQMGGTVDPTYDGPFSDPIYRQAFSMSIDRAAAFTQIYTPIGGETATLLNCGPIAPGPYCDNASGAFADTYDPEGAATLLTENGWTQDGSGMWVNPDGEVPQVRWIINTGNTRRESMQAYLIPLLADAGFDVVPDNCDAACYFQQRLPALDYDMAMYISSAPPDPTYLTSSFTCSQIPTEANDYVGQNSTGWCNEDASAALIEADQTVDAAARVDLVKSALQAMADDHIMLPLFQFPNSHLWRTDKLDDASGARDTNNYMGFARTLPFMEDLDGDGKVVIGAEQWPECLNPITECANSTWYVHTVSFAVMPGLWDTTNSQEFVATDLLASEPVVEVL